MVILNWGWSDHYFLSGMILQVCHKMDPKNPVRCIGKLVGGWTNPSEKYDRQIGNLPQIGLQIKNVWNHHLENPLIFGHLFRGYPCPYIHKDRLLWIHTTKSTSFSFQRSPWWNSFHGISRWVGPTYPRWPKCFTNFPKKNEFHGNTLIIHNNPLIRPYLLGGGSFGGGYPRFPWELPEENTNDKNTVFLRWSWFGGNRGRWFFGLEKPWIVVCR